ncbi:Crp/Fnr family transcriptional regulator [Hyphomicrobium sp. MC1]|uniref:Crp/Fnr family transcriptional regulator n=1 Tax=Hyphomicrobium sp. (strain MC1) TaxID=717785 RepID=UPI000682DD7F|nr:Crp/Fnr family transcriptional regulator [Hyphomicrobium sp. MC1]
MRLAARQVLFREGDARTIFYRVETGAICVYEPRRNDERSVIDFAFPGDFVGVGFLETQSCSANAVCECQVSCFPWAQLTSVIAGNVSAQQKLQIAIEREFEHRRTNIVARGRQFPLERIAAFLLALSHNNVFEGRDPNVIGDSMECGIADLGLGIDDLGSLLIELRERGLIGPSSPNGIRILDDKALEDLASGRVEFGQVERVTDRSHFSRARRMLGYQMSAA